QRRIAGRARRELRDRRPQLLEISHAGELARTSRQRLDVARDGGRALLDAVERALDPVGELVEATPDRRQRRLDGVDAAGQLLQRVAADGLEADAEVGQAGLEARHAAGQLDDRLVELLLEAGLLRLVRERRIERRSAPGTGASLARGRAEPGRRVRPLLGERARQLEPRDRSRLDEHLPERLARALLRG